MVDFLNRDIQTGDRVVYTRGRELRIKAEVVGFTDTKVKIKELDGVYTASVAPGNLIVYERPVQAPKVNFNVTARPPASAVAPHMQVAKAIAAVPQKEKKKTATYNLSLEQIEDIKRKCVREATEAAWVLMLGLPVMQLSDKHDFDNDELDKFIDGIMDKYDSYERGLISLADIHTALYEEAGIQLLDGRSKNWRKKT